VRIPRSDSRTLLTTEQPPNQYFVLSAYNFMAHSVWGREYPHWYYTSRHAKNILIPQITKDDLHINVSFQQDGAPPHIHANVEDY
jgi:hypothetical protein